jgi:glycosyltransferase involved in cell wall biosynthesis
MLGGAEKNVQLVAEELVDRGHDVSIVSTIGKKEFNVFSYDVENDSGITIFRYKPKNIFQPIDIPDKSTWKFIPFKFIDVWNPHSYLMLRKILQNISPDLVHLHNYEGHSGAAFTVLGEYPTPFVHTLHDYSLLHVQPSMYRDGEIWEPNILFKPYHIINRKLTESADKSISPSKFLIQKHREYNFFRQSEHKVIQNGVRIQDEPQNKKDTPVDSEEIRLLYVGRVSSDKGVDTLIDAVELNSEDNIRLDILGKGAEREKLEESTTDPNIQFHGFVPEDDLISAYKNAHATVVPSKWLDNSPTVIYESISMGTPVIASDIGGIPELLTNETGFLFTPKDAIDLSKTISEAFDEISQKTYQACASRRQHFSITRHVDELLDVYQELINC